MNLSEGNHLKKLFFQNRENKVLTLKFSLVVFLFLQIVTFFVSTRRQGNFIELLPLLIITFGLTLYALYKVNYNNLRFPTIIVSNVFILAGIVIVILYGTGTVNGILMIITGITIISLVTNARYALIAFIIISVALITISVLQEITHTIDYKPEDNRSHLDFTLSILFGISVITTILWLSTRQVEYSREKAIEYAWRLEQLNQELEKKVKQRTSELVKSQQKQVSQLHQLSTLGRISSGLVHDIANHITTIQVNMDLLKEIKPKDIKPYIERINKSTTAISNLIEITRDQAVGKETKTTFDPVNELAIALTFLEYKAKVNQAIITQHHTSKVKLYGNPIKFNQIVVNLVSNAIEALKGSKIRRVIIQSRATKGFFILSVKDTGHGINEKERKRIFDTFYSTKGPRRLGMGLSIIQDAVESFKGKLDLKTKEGEGTEFIIKFPLKRRKPLTRLK